MDKAEFSASAKSFIQKHIRLNETLSRFIKRVFANETQSQDFLAALLKNPRRHRQNFMALRSAFPDNKSFTRWFFGEKGYYKAYINHVHHLWNTTQNIETLLSFLPNFNPWCLQQRFGKIRLGMVPEIFGDEQVFLEFIEKIRNAPEVENYKKIKNLEHSPEKLKKAYPEVKKIDLYDFGQRASFFRAILKKGCGNLIKIKANNHIFKIRFLCNPFSAKLVFQITSSDGQVFILKMMPYDLHKKTDDKTVKEHENHAIRADSIYTNAMLEHYLILNNCPHAPGLLYYNYDYDIALYQEDKGTQISLEDKPFYFRTFYEFNHKMLKDANLLGIYVNDINKGNFLVSDKDNKLKIIDIGHASYANPLNPGVTGLCLSPNNLCGQDFLVHYGDLFF